MEEVSSAESIIPKGAAELARRIQSGELSSRQTVDAFIDRIQTVQPHINAATQTFFDAARTQAAAADERQAAGESLGPLHGVPFSVKECFAMAGTAATIGLTTRTQAIDKQNNPLVDRLLAAGGIPLAKTNVPQLMIWHECDNPVFGRTNNPWDLTRSPGGSSGGEGALIGAGASPLGLSGDLGGSIRLPAHFCGVQGIKPTNFRLPREGTVETFRGMESLIYQPGPMARRVEDLELALSIMVENKAPQATTPPVPWQGSATVDLSKLRVGYYIDDGYFPPSPAMARAVELAIQALRDLGVQVEPLPPPDMEEAMALYLGLMGADGGLDFRRIARGSKLDHRVRRLMRISRIPRRARPLVAAALRAGGQHRQADLLSRVYARTADEYWRLTHRLNDFVSKFIAQMSQHRFDAILTPPHALPAMPHGVGIDMLSCASYSFLPNLLGMPVGVVAVTRVQEDEQDGRPASRDRVESLAQACDKNSAGLPIGVQVMARHWREDVALALMAAVEAAADRHPHRVGVDQLPAIG